MEDPIALDAILALQITVARAGEGLCEPGRLGWHRTDLVDEAGGGDLFRRLFPGTHAWASLEAVRKAAILVDARARQSMASPDMVRTLFFQGFDLDDKLEERLAFHKGESTPPARALPFPVDPYGEFDASELEKALLIDGKKAPYKIVPGGRELTGPLPDAPEAKVAHLAAALVPFADEYPTPFYRITDG